MRATATVMASATMVPVFARVDSVAHSLPTVQKKPVPATAVGKECVLLASASALAATLFLTAQACHALMTAMARDAAMMAPASALLDGKDATVPWSRAQAATVGAVAMVFVIPRAIALAIVMLLVLPVKSLDAPTTASPRRQKEPGVCVTLLQAHASVVQMLMV